MTLTICAVVMQTVLLASPADTTESYAEVRRQTAESGKPMIVMVGTDWCGPCQAMKRNILPKLRERGLFKKVAFAQVNADKDAQLAKDLTGGGPVPQLVMYRKTERGWLRRKLIGGQTVEKVEQFIKQELAQDQIDHKNEPIIGRTVSESDSKSSESLPAELPEESHKT